MIICCKCGISIQPRLMNMCDRCIATEIDLSSTLKTNLIIEHCRGCDRYFTPPKSWQTCEWGSKDLLILLLKHNKSLQKYKLIDSDFVYTEEHSKKIEISVKLKQDHIEQEVNIKYKIRNKQCPDCQKVEAKQYWTSIVQVRQRVQHKRTLLYLEQILLKSESFKDTSNIKERRDGIDFYYQNKVPALRMVNFIQNAMMSRIITSGKLITEDRKSNTCKYKFSYSVEIVPICRDDCIIVSERVAQKYGIGRINIVLKVNTNFVMIDPLSMKITEINGRNYWGYQDEFQVLMSSKNLKKFKINEIEKTELKNGKYCQSDANVSISENENFHCKTHLGNILREGETVLGYDFEHSTMSEYLDGNFKVFLIRKEASKNRKYKIKTKKNTDREYDLFMEDICNDEELEKNVNLYDEKENIIRNLRNMEFR
ncbi:ribosome-binding protein [Gurleya vavrai]